MGMSPIIYSTMRSSRNREGYQGDDPGPGRAVSLFFIVTLLGLMVIGFLLATNDNDCAEWLSWKQDNTYPNCHSFEITEEGENGWFGSIKALYDLEVYPGQYVCVRVDADNDNYGWMVMLYYGARAEPGTDRAENKNHKPSTMFQFGSSFWLIRNGEMRCSKVPPIYHYRKELPGPFVVFKVHWAGFGKGGVTATPHVIISDTDLSEE